jgi:N-acetylmuramoyl-L-alanine amidase
MRAINYIVIHCTATAKYAKISSIITYWREQLKWTNPGYHYMIEFDGTVNNLLPDSEVANGVRGYNSHSIHIAYIGGLNGRDDRTNEQREAMLLLLLHLRKTYPDAEILGHRDFPNVKKECPCFDVKKWLNIKIV